MTCLYRRESSKAIHPSVSDQEFLQLFAATSEDIVSIKRGTRGAELTRQALVMLQKWATRETTTYGQLRERLRTLSVFHI